MTGKEAPPSEQEGQQWPGEVQPLVAIVISVVQLSSAKSSQQQPVDHVPETTVIHTVMHTVTHNDIHLSRPVRWHSPGPPQQVAFTCPCASGGTHLSRYVRWDSP